MFLKHVLRSDLYPVPETLECTLRLDPELEPFISEGSIVKSGRFDNEYKIVKKWRNTEVQEVQGNRPHGSYSFIALLKHCWPMAAKRESPVIFRGSTFGEIYRACGATAKIESDMPIVEFGCLAGDVPSFSVARLLQEEAAAMTWTGKALKFMRLDDLFKQDPVQRMSADSSEDVQSTFAERHQIPTFLSVDEDGKIIYGNTEKARHATFVSRMDERRLRNMTKVLINKKTGKSAYAPQISAGQLIEIAERNYAVITAAHVTRDSGHTGVSMNAYSKFWLGLLPEVSHA